MALTTTGWRGLVAAAAALPTAAVHEAYDRRGDLPPAIKPVSPNFRLAGRAFTVSCPTGHNLHLHHAVVTAQPGDVLVVDVRTGPDFGYWGEILSEAARAAGLAGLVINGCVRDHDEVIEVGFPIFSTGLCVRGTGKSTTGGSIAAPVRIGRVDVSTGDLVIGDADGAVVVKRADVEGVVVAAKAREAKEKAIVSSIRQGTTTLELYDFPQVDP